MKKISLEEFTAFLYGDIFAVGILTDDDKGINMTGSGQKLKWIAVKGGFDDWCIYCHWASYSIDYIRSNGDKVTFREHILKCVECEEEMFRRYRY